MNRLLKDFVPEVYLANNQDLRTLNLSYDQARNHFSEHGKRERRIYANYNNMAERISMQYLRGHGIELGCGSSPVLLCEDVLCDYADIVEQSIYDPKNATTNKIIYNLNSDSVPKSSYSKYNFVVARHVLEHTDSMIRSIRSLGKFLCKGGHLYLALPVIDSMADRFWLPHAGKVHHLAEFMFPNIHKRSHIEKFFHQNNGSGMSQYVGGSSRSFSLDEFEEQFAYVVHRHNYSVENWISLLLWIRKYFLRDLRVIDVSICSVRDDLNIVFVKE